MREIKVRTKLKNGVNDAVRPSWTIDVERGLLTDAQGVEIRLEPRLSKLMSLLLDNAGDLVSRRELMERMWPDTIVTDQSLTRAVADLRRFLRENFLLPPVIETASKQGYRLSLPVNPSATDRRGLWTTARLIAYAIGGAVIVVLVLRGLSY